MIARICILAALVAIASAGLGVSYTDGHHRPRHTVGIVGVKRIDGIGRERLDEGWRGWGEGIGRGIRDDDVGLGRGRIGRVGLEERILDLEGAGRGRGRGEEGGLWLKRGGI